MNMNNFSYIFIASPDVFTRSERSALDLFSCWFRRGMLSNVCVCVYSLLSDSFADQMIVREILKANWVFPGEMLHRLFGLWRNHSFTEWFSTQSVYGVYSHERPTYPTFQRKIEEIRRNIGKRLNMSLDIWCFCKAFVVNFSHVFQILSRNFYLFDFVLISMWNVYRMFKQFLNCCEFEKKKSLFFCIFIQVYFEFLLLYLEYVLDFCHFYRKLYGFSDTFPVFCAGILNVRKFPLDFQIVSQ